MKTRFTTLDICAVLSEINSTLTGMRLANVYDINNKTYLLKLAKPDVKAMLLMESGIRLHRSEFDWPKNMMPSGFSMKLRKHLKGRRLVSAKQLGIDRIVDLQFGSDEAAYHVILELYDRGNIILTDHTYTILNLLRYRTENKTDSKDGDNEEVRFAVHERYPVDSAKTRSEFSDVEHNVRQVLKDCKKNDSLKRILNPHLPFGAPCIEHCLLSVGFPPGVSVGKGFEADGDDADRVISALKIGNSILDSLCCGDAKGYIIQKREKKRDDTTVQTNVEFHPVLFKQFEGSDYSELPSFNKAADEFFGNLESQKADLKIVQLEKSAQKRLDNIKKDHEQRLTTLETQQDTDIYKARLIEENLPLVEQAIRVVRTAIANQIDWNEIISLIKDAQAGGDPVACAISNLDLQSNEFAMVLTKQAVGSDSSDEENTSLTHSMGRVKVVIDLGLSAYGNAKKYYSRKKQASHKQQRIVESSQKAYKSAEKKMKQTFEEANKIHNIQKARKTFWFEKFVWFVSSENYLVIGGRDAQQNEILVKKYLTESDVYVHADLHGATSCIIKNHGKSEIPPKTLNEAGTMAICHSAAWDAKVVTSAWWVRSSQVSKTAPSGEYLTTGSFLIRGKKNYLPPSNLVYGFGIVFKVDETCVHKHQDERRVVSIDAAQIGDSESLGGQQETELVIESGDSDGDETSEENAMLDLAGKVGLKESTDSNRDIVIDRSGGVENQDVAGDLEADRSLGDAGSSVENSIEAGLKGSIESSRETVTETSQNETRNSDAENHSLQSNNADRSEENPDSCRNIEPPAEKGVAESDFPEFPDTNVKVAFANEKSSRNEAAGRKSSSRDEIEDVRSKGSDSGRAQPKRGHRHKQKKMKSKYKDQDEEERSLKMELLQQSQSQKARDRKAKKNKAAARQSNAAGGGGNNRNRPDKGKAKSQHKSNPAETGYDSEEERAKVLENEHLNRESSGILSSLTGCPFHDDILLFALPVCAPYNTMHNYKFKVKLTPGNTKKGKAAKSALSLFQSMRETSPLEKDHLRSIKDHDLARNIPGKVKVSSTGQQSQKKKKGK